MKSQTTTNPSMISFAPTTLVHLTLNTGHIRNSPRREVHKNAINALIPLVRDGGGDGRFGGLSRLDDNSKN